ncbi:MAG TPA: glycoside hydrolase family 3 N-terminal domain-containing protein, partial [Spirochaetia bacterium]|nr:glycoside hydrolase family 3 N-terminal domain-containing protein [Spirochaetia bacterium]
ATLFPAGINYGATWDPDLIRRAAGDIGTELASIGSKQGLAPVLDVSRDARWGRTEETFGEDPYLAGCLATAYVEGLQGPNRRVLATLKHFVGHSFSEGGRNHAPVRIGERELNDIFLLPFEMAVKIGKAGSVMPAYHDIDGEPSTTSRHYLTEVLRDQWGFDGLIVSDYEAISLLFDHHRVASDAAEASALSIKAGMDVELPGFTCYRTGIEEALDRGLLSIDDVDRAVLRVLVEKYRLGLFENPYMKEDAIVLNTEAHRATAAETAEKSIVLLKNDGLLPLSPDRVTALVGPLADDPNSMFCGYSFPVHVANGLRAPESGVRYGTTLKEALAERLPSDRLVWREGCRLLGKRLDYTPVFPGELEGAEREQMDIVSYDRGGIAEAVEAASRADQIIVAVGDIAGLFLSGTVGEGSDTSSLELPGVQQELLEGILDIGKPVVVVLINGRPYNIGSGFVRAGAVIEAWLPGQEGGEVLADILLGLRSPGGRLPVSIPKTAGAMPYFYNHKLKSPGTPVQRDFGAVYPFGFGLTYTSFEFGDFSLASREVSSDGEVIVAGNVKNTGRKKGDAVVQLYIRDLVASLVRPVKELKAFKRVSLEAGQSARIELRLPVDMLSFTTHATERIVEPGDFEIMVGTSSEDFVFRDTVTIGGNIRTLPKNWRMQSEVTVTFT